jgi:membrane fusion protein (multidrug efflux system)
MLALMAGCGQKGPPPAPPPAEVTVIKAAPAPVTLYEDYVAQTEAVDTVEIRSRVNGILERQGYVDGERVKGGHLLFVIDRQPYLVALAQAKANLGQAQAALVNSRQNLARARPLLEDQAISKQELDAFIAKEAADAATVDAAQAQVRAAELNLDYTAITAPRDGTVSKALVKPGGLVNASSTLLTTLYSLDPINVSFTLPEQRLLELGTNLKVSGGAGDKSAVNFRLKRSDGSDYKYPGRLMFLDAAIDPRTGTLQARLTVPNTEHELRPGQFMRVVMPARESRDAILVPQRAVQEIQGKQSVMVVGAENKVAPRDIVARNRVGSDWIVDSGLNAGDLVIVDGISKVRPGAQVKPVFAAPPAKPGSQPAAPAAAGK